MANLSELTRKAQVLAVLTEHKGLWVDGTLLATEEVGGSEGLKRLRELRQEGYMIQQRKHPEPGRSIYQYRLVEQSTLLGPPVAQVPADLLRPRSPSSGGSPSGQRSGTTGSDSDYRPRDVVPGQTSAFGRESEIERGFYDWKPGEGGELRAIYWIRKQRVIATIATDGRGWFWGVKIPRHRPKNSPWERPERIVDQGRLLSVGPSGRDDAIRSCESVIKHLRESLDWRPEGAAT